MKQIMLKGGCFPMMLSERIHNELTKIASAYLDIEKVYLFGSRARGDAEERSDIDLAFDAPSMKENDWTQLYFQIHEELDTLLMVDLVKLDKASKELIKNIKKEGCVIYDKHENKAELGKPRKRT
jgi:predicted nucleotidyltransferase